MSKITGHIDHMGRPVISLDMKGESLVVLVDTGFNGKLMLNKADAYRFGFSVMESEAEIVLADGQKQKILEGYGYLLWFGKLQEISVFITKDKVLRRRDDDPVAIIGTKLLTPHVLKIDYAKSTVEINSQK